MPAVFRIAEEIKERCKTLYLQGVPLSQIATVQSVKLETVRKWSKRYGWDKLVDEAKALIVQVTGRDLKRHPIAGNRAIALSSNGLSTASSELRQALSSEIAAQVATLTANPVKRVAELRNTPEGEGRASVVKKIVETAAIIHDWDGSSTPGLIVVADMKGTAPEERESPVIDILPAEIPSPPAPSAALLALQED